MTAQIESSSVNSETLRQPTKSQNPLDNLAEKKRLKEIATFVNEEYRKCKASRITIERIWYKNLSYYLGNQWVTYLNDQLAGGSGKLYTPKAPPWRTRMTINRIKPIIRTELARVTSQKPNASVVPASSEDEDLFAAQAGEQVWESTYSRLQIHRRFSRAAWWTLLTGNGFLKSWWDEEKVDKYSNVKGDLCVEPVTPFHIFVPDLTEEELENQVYVIHAYTRPVGQARLEFPELQGKLQPTLVSSSEIMDDAMLKVGANNKPDSVLYLEMWLKPGAHKDYPNGGMIQVIDRFVVAEHKEIPYDHGEFPFIKFDHVPTGKFYSDSVIVDLIPIQREYNRTRSQIIEAKNRMAKPQLVAPRGSVEAGKITSEPGILIEYNPGFDRPAPLPLQPLPSYVIEELNRSIMDMEDISAQHQVSKGNVPSGVTAATAISYLQERDDSVLTHTYNSIEQGFEKLAKQLLALAVQYWDVPHIVKVTGTDGAFDAIALKGAQIEKGTDIRMESGSSLPVSKAARQAFLMDLMKMGFIDPQQGLRIMEIGGVQKLYDQLQVDERQAQRENLRMKMLEPEEIVNHNQMVDQFRMQTAQMQAQDQLIPPQLQDVMNPQGMPPSPDANFGSAAAPANNDPTMQDTQTGMPLQPPSLVPVNTWDNHPVHIEVHNRFRKSQSFEMLSDEHKAVFEEHVQAHAMALNQAAMNASMQQTGDMGVPPLSQSEGGQPPSPDSGGGQPPGGMIPNG